MQIHWMILGTLASWAICLPVQYRFRRQNRTVPAQILKALPTLGLSACVLLYHFLKCPADTYSLMVGIALFMATLGDLMLNLVLPVGGVFFFLCHVCNCVAYTQLLPFQLWMIPLALGLFALTLLIGGKNLRKINKHPLFCIGIYGYTLMLTVMLSMTLPLPFLIKSPQAIWAGIGGACFVASDAYLLENTVRKRSGWYRLSALLLYYAAQAMIAISAVC